MEQKNKKLVEIIEEVCSAMCDKYCKYNEILQQAKDDDEYNAMVKEYCESCPLDRLQ